MLNFLRSMDLLVRTLVAIVFFLPSGILFRMAMYIAPTQETAQGFVLGHVVSARERWGENWEEVFTNKLRGLATKVMDK